MPTTATLPTGLDPAATLADHGPAALTGALLDRARPLVDAVIERRLAGWTDRLRWVEGRIGALRDVAPLIAALPPGHASRHATGLARTLDLDPTTVYREVSAHRGQPPPRTAAHTTASAGRRPPAQPAAARSR